MHDSQPTCANRLGRSLRQTLSRSSTFLEKKSYKTLKQRDVPLTLFEVEVLNLFPCSFPVDCSEACPDVCVSLKHTKFKIHYIVYSTKDLRRFQFFIPWEH